MQVDTPSAEINALITNPRESLAVEVKDWLDLTIPSHRAKVIKALIALRNFNGGYLVIGFDDRTMEPGKNVPTQDQRAVYSADAIQSLISNYVSEPFEVNVQFPERDGVTHPVIIVPAGVRSPVAAKKDLRDGQQPLICTHDVYVRSLNSNNVASSSKVLWRDWPNVMQVCFDNREADIGNFLRRHLGVGARDRLLEVLSETGVGSRRKNLDGFLIESNERFQRIASEMTSIPRHSYWETAMSIHGNVPPQRLNMDFLRRLDAHNPRYTGWPVWMNTERFANTEAHPYVFENRLFESVIATLDATPRHFDFMRFDPKGRFYLRRAYQDDLVDPPRGPEPLTQLDFALPILRVAETIGVGLAFAKGLGCTPEDSSLSYEFAWHGLRGRVLSSWASPDRLFWGSRAGDRDEARSYIEVPLDAPMSRIGSYTKDATDPLFDAFDENISQELIDELTTKLITRTLAN